MYHAHKRCFPHQGQAREHSFSRKHALLYLLGGQYRAVVVLLVEGLLAVDLERPLAVGADDLGTVKVVVVVVLVLLAVKPLDLVPEGNVFSNLAFEKESCLAFEVSPCSYLSL